MSLSTARMAEKDNQQYSGLLEKQKRSKLSRTERDRLAELAEEYERGTLRKAFAMAEAVRRGLMPPLQS